MSERSTSSLSASAPAFSPSAPTPPVNHIMDTFAQTNPQAGNQPSDAPEESMETRASENLFDDDFTPIPEPVVEQPAPETPRAARGDKRERGTRGRGRGGGEGRRRRGGARAPAQAREGAGAPSSLLQSQHAPAPAQPQQPSQQAQNPTPAAQDNSLAPASSLLQSRHAPPTPGASKPAPVRGDRLSTGGLRKPKLTEAELAEKLNRMKLQNASLAAAHERAEADAASFHQREAEAAQKRQEERRDRQQMLGERERNRLRKLKATEGREWDAEKRDEDLVGRGGGRGAARGPLAAL
ncbi:hypothetical protein H2203_000346 [Taxawa tesnikishii (nom. ined.)]|nr:hypothetical protein H2203_000346 [Dothideales sp. JES 119]